MVTDHDTIRPASSATVEMVRISAKPSSSARRAGVRMKH
jgi:hypothetical protein